MTAGAKDKEKKTTDDSDTDATKSKVVERATDNEDEIDVYLDDGDPHTDDTKEPEAEVEECATGGILPRISTRERKNQSGLIPTSCIKLRVVQLINDCKQYRVC